MALTLVRRLVKGSALTAAEHDANLNALETAIEEPLVRGQASKTTSGTVTIGAQGVYQTTGLTATFDSTTAQGMVLGTNDTFGIRNTSGSTRLIQFYASIEAVDGNNHMIGIKLAKNGTPLNQTECRGLSGSSSHEILLVTNWMVSMANNDEVSVFVANIDAISNIELRRARLVAIEVR